LSSTQAIPWRVSNTDVAPRGPWLTFEATPGNDDGAPVFVLSGIHLIVGVDVVYHCPSFRLQLLGPPIGWASVPVWPNSKFVMASDGARHSLGQASHQTHGDANVTMKMATLANND